MLKSYQEFSGVQNFEYSWKSFQIIFYLEKFHHFVLCAAT